MKQRWQVALVFAVEVLLLLALFGIWLLVRSPRPFFGNHSIGGRWDFGNGLGLADDRYVYYDLEENVLMVVVVETNRVVWLVDAQPVGPILRVVGPSRSRRLLMVHRAGSQQIRQAGNDWGDSKRPLKRTLRERVLWRNRWRSRQ